jgi:8-oxo-dGTP pyrophosphatase MutT (NUDIX family)
MRELREETGLLATIGTELWTKAFRIEHPQGIVDQEEQYFLVQVAEPAPPVHNSSTEAILEHRWWSLAELIRTSEVVYPQGLASDVQALLDERGT